MLRNTCFELLTTAICLFVICVHSLDEDSKEYNGPLDTLQYSNEVFWLSHDRPRRESSEDRGSYRNPNPWSGRYNTQTASQNNYSKYKKYQNQVPKSEYILALKKKRYMGMDIPDYIVKQNQEIPGFDGGQPQGAMKQKLSNIG